jgi:hypothetical protein
MIMQSHSEYTENIEVPALKYARRLLRKKQREQLKTELLRMSSPSITDTVLTIITEMTRFNSTEVPHIIRRGAYRYDRETECDRIARAQALIRRVDPSALEDPNYFAILAYQAASIEMAYENMAIQSIKSFRFSKYLLGTVHSPDFKATSQRVTSDGYTIVMLHSGLIDFIYQAAKVIVEALDPLRSANGRSAVKAVFDLAMIQTRIDSNHGAAERLYRVFEAYFFNGYPRASAFETIPPEHYPMLSLIVGMAERWIIGHEYGHGLATLFGQVPVTVNPDKAEEYFSDNIATILTVLSAGELDAVPPEFPIGGAIFSLACLDLIKNALNIVSTGMETTTEPEEATHPTARDRALSVINCFRQFFDVDYHPNGLFDLSFVLRKNIPKDHHFSIEHSKRAYAYANVLQTVWKPIKKRLRDDFNSKRPLNPIWKNY